MESSSDIAPFCLDRRPAFDEGLSAQQTVQPSDLTQKEADFYQNLTDPKMAKSFIITRSYVRLCRQVIDYTLPPLQLPDKPLGFSARFLLSGETTMINTAISESLKAEFRTMVPAKP